VRAREQNPEHYRRRLQELYSLLAWMGLVLALFITLFGGLLIRTLFGDAYERAGPMLAIHIWAGPFVFMGTLFSNWLIAETRFGVSAVRHGLGAVMNIGLNLLLIPHFGGIGAAWATLVSYATAQYLACFTYRPTFETGVMMTSALLTGPIEIARMARRRGFFSALRPGREAQR
jgi:O-antigen/teichoic acid export membrane protein